MAIDFSQVKTITIPEGTVTKITDPNGLFGTQRTIWQKYHYETIWSGNTRYGSGGTDAPEDHSGSWNYYTATLANSPYQYGMKIRCTFSEMGAYTGGGTSLDVTSTTPEDKTSPYTVTITDDTSSPVTLLSTYAYQSYAQQTHQVYITYNKSTGDIVVQVGKHYQGSYGNFTSAYITLTKIEVMRYDYLYRRLEYVTCNKDAAIKTGIWASTNTTQLNTFYFKFMPTNIGTQQRILANYNPDASLKRKYALVMNTNGELQNVAGGDWGASINAVNNTEYVVESSMVYNNRYLTVNGTNYPLSNCTQESGSNNTDYGFGAGWHTGNSGFENGFAGRLYGLKATRPNSVQAYYYIPVQRKSDNTVGFACIKTNSSGTTAFDSFMPSTWTNDFGAGPVTQEDFDETVVPNMNF